MGIILAVSIVFVYIVLSMLYESWFIPFAVLLSVPSGMVGSFLFVRLFGLENNIYLRWVSSCSSACSPRQPSCSPSLPRSEDMKECRLPVLPSQQPRSVCAPSS